MLTDGRKVMAIAHMTLWVRWAKNDFDRKNMFILVYSRNDFKREFILRHVRDLKHDKREMPHCSQVNKHLLVSNVSILVNFSVAKWLSLQLWFHIWFEMSFLKHEKISLQKYSMLKIVQDKYLIKTLVATLLRIRRSKEQHNTDSTNSQNISHRLIRACMYQLIYISDLYFITI